MDYNSDTAEKYMQLNSSIHLQKDSEGGGVMVDDRTFSCAHLNETAYILLQALQQPCTREELITILANAAECEPEDAVASVEQLTTTLRNNDWIEAASV